MKVMCHKIISESTNEDLGKESPWLTIGKEYVVLGMKLHPVTGIQILIQSDADNSPIFSRLLGFEVTSQLIPASWVIQNDNGIVYMLPQSWTYDSFLDDIDDSIPEAWEIFEKEAAIMYAEEGFVIENTH